MADRKVTVTLTAQVTGLLQGMDKAAKATRDVASEADKLKAKSQAFGDIGRAAMVGGAVVAAGIALAIVKFAEFDQAMSQVKAATQETAENMGLLREAAIQAGAATQYSATEAANAIEELGKAGLTTQQILSGGLSGALTLAAAGGIGVAEAAGYAAIAMKQFGLEGSALPHVADLLGAGAGKAVGDVSDLSQALGQAGLVANGAGQSIEDTTGVLAAFADAGLLGSDAGTSLKSAIIALQAPTDKAAALMDEYNLKFYDGNGAMLSYQEIAGQLTTNLSDLTEEERNATLAKIFGNDALRAANVLYKEGESGIQGYIDQTNDAGYAAKVAADRMDNLAGDVEKLGGSFDTALIRTGSGANEVLRDIVQSAGFLVDLFGSLPEPVLNVALALGVAAAATLLAGGAALVAVPKYAALKSVVADTGVSMGRFALKTAATGGALALATIAVGYFVSRAADAAATTAELTDSLDQSTGALTDYSREIIAKKLAESGAFDSAKDLGISQKELTDAVIEGGDALDKIKSKLAGKNNIVDFFNGSGIAAGNAKDQIQQLAQGVVDSKSDFENQAAAVDGSTASTESAADAYTAAADEAQGLTDNLTELIDTINAANGVGQDAVSTNASYQKALSEVDAAIKNIDPATGKAKEATEALAKSVDESTAAGSANADMFRDLAEKSQASADAQFALDNNSENYRKNIEAGRQTLYDQILALTGNADAAQALTDKIYAIPSEAEFKVIAETAQAAWTIDDFIAKQGKKVGVINFRSQLTDLNGAAVSGTGRMGTFSTGGPTGGSSKQEVRGLVHGMEFVSTAETYADPANRAVLEYMHNGGSMGNYGASATPQYASSAAAPASVTVSPAAAPAIYVQNPFTGEYLLAKVDGRISSADSTNAQTSSTGRRVR